MRKFVFSFWSVWYKLVIVPSFLWYIILPHSNEIRPAWRYFNKYVYLKILISVTFLQNKIIKISPCRSDLLHIRNQYLQLNIWYNYQFVPDTSKTMKKILIDAHYKLGQYFLTSQKNVSIFELFPGCSCIVIMKFMLFLARPNEQFCSNTTLKRTSLKLFVTSISEKQNRWFPLENANKLVYFELSHKLSLVFPCPSSVKCSLYRPSYKIRIYTPSPSHRKPTHCVNATSQLNHHPSQIHKDHTVGLPTFHFLVLILFWSMIIPLAIDFWFECMQKIES